MQINHSAKGGGLIQPMKTSVLEAGLERLMN